MAAFELEAFDYILEPYHEQRIVTMLHKLEANGRLTAATLNTHGSRTSHTVNLMKDERIIVTDIDNLYYAVAQEKVTRVYTRREVFTMPMEITEFCDRLPEEVFFRCTALMSSTGRRSAKLCPGLITPTCYASTM